MLSKIEAWPQLSTELPMVIAGPCSAETEAQVLTIAKALKKDPRISLFRAGVWKPRTRPGGFEGVGNDALNWLKKVKNEIGLPVSTEVANASHVEKALNADIDVLWLGARTTANPFAVQEISSALKGVDIPVMVKNPVNPDVGLWLGAIERLEKAGISRLGGIHRGVSQFVKTEFRNKPEWDMVVRLREELSDFLIVNDPSHIAGNRTLIERVSQTALDLKLDGLMIETHHTPQEAWSDAEQQVTPQALKEMLTRLIIKFENPGGFELDNLNELRYEINGIDRQIIDLFANRSSVVKDIAKIKMKHKMSLFQESRFNELLANHLNQASSLGLDESFVSKIFHSIHQESILIQSKLSQKK